MNRAWDIAAGLVIALHLAAQAVDAHTLADGTQVLLVPALAGAVWNRAEVPHGSRPARLYAGALFFSWIGDAAPRVFADEAGFIAMVTAFGVAQVCFVATFVRLRSRPLRPIVALGYLAGFVGLFAACVSGAGPLLPLVAVYGLVLVAAAAVSTRVNTMTGIGGLIFFISDALLGLESFSAWYALPSHDLIVMTTYIAAQVLIAAGLLRHWRVERQAPADPGGDEPADSPQTGDGDVQRTT
ncbi:lysoplasmalogenase [Ruania halotolerans]|uniref:lysoplasmalogenase n=1 Tax=Ruania halotolerans TaxID=2897773 RepID=UPI001E4854A0|nr:lysoplasmalogenase [Ruania halotolerans]UFU04811.1 lysoplasmalogenase [Ruania halotolerans]